MRCQKYFIRWKWYISSAVIIVTALKKSVTAYDADGHQGALKEPGQDIGGVVLVVGHPGQASVEGYHDEGELGQWAQQAGSVPS